MFYDSNDIQLSTETKDVMTEDTAMKYRAWGWNVLEINGNDCDEIRKALDAAKAETKRPTLIIGKCIKTTTLLTNATARLTVLLLVVMLTRIQ